MISTKGRYALRVMAELASRGTEDYVSLKSVAQKQDISEKYLESIVSMLVKAGLLDGHRGKGGGYRLTRAPENYTAADILRATEGSLAPVACIENGSCVCERADNCMTLPIWKKLEEITEEYLESVSLSDIISPSDGGNYVI